MMGVKTFGSETGDARLTVLRLKHVPLSPEIITAKDRALCFVQQQMLEATWKRRVSRNENEPSCCVVHAFDRFTLAVGDMRHGRKGPRVHHHVGEWISPELFSGMEFDVAGEPRFV